MATKTTIGIWLHRMRRVLATLCLALLATAIGYKVVYGANGTLEWRGKRAEYHGLQRDIDQDNADHRALEERVRKLQTDRNTIIKEAREKLGYVMPGEVVLVQPQPKADVRSSSVAQVIPSPNPSGK
ncbi:MAG TPA: septum formation initiator family protein [Candidatus Angelobacter sp.]|nr:septum formation initiator family protein [Candidatus Angelobacter sp.]